MHSTGQAEGVEKRDRGEAGGTPWILVEGGQAGGGVGGPPFAVDFSGLFFTGDGPRLPG